MSSNPNETPKQSDSNSESLERGDKAKLFETTPIIITGGSLTLESVGVDFSQFTPEGTRILHHPRNSKIIAVDIIDGNDVNASPRFTYVPPADSRCIIKILY
jgi:hypothetical protein